MSTPDKSDDKLIIMKVYHFYNNKKQKKEPKTKKYLMLSEISNHFCGGAGFGFVTGNSIK